MAVDIRTLGEADLDALLRIRRTTFGYHQALEPEAAAERFGPRLAHTRGVFVAGELVASAAVLPFRMHFAGRPVAMGGLASVQTPPEARRRGYVRMLLEDALERLHQAGVGWCLEYPFEPGFYTRYGWQSVANGIEVELPTELLLGRRKPNARRLTIDELDEIRPIYDRWAPGYTFTLDREGGARDPWRRLVKAPWERLERLVYRFDGAYCILSYGPHDPATGSQTLEVEDYAYADPEGRRELFAFLGAFSGHLDRVRLQLPPDDPLVCDVLQRHVRASRAVLQARVVDVGAALEALASPDERELVIEVRDDVCARNRGRFEVALSPAGVRVAPGGGEPDLRLDVRALALLLSNSVSPEGVHRAGLVEGDLGALRALQRTVAGYAPFMPFADFF